EGKDDPVERLLIDSLLGNQDGARAGSYLGTQTLSIATYFAMQTNAVQGLGDQFPVTTGGHQDQDPSF
ncbi:MAG: hypothetical protein H0U23_08725, partial [Blastocatellia bacterium]|nr:hypothetical protein [Blastocatellia bacterium]